MGRPAFVPTPGESSSTVLLALAVATTFVALSVSGCGDGGRNGSVTNPPVQLTLTANPSDPETGQTVLFTVTGSSSQDTITTSRIDFDDDGSWDDTHSHNGSAVSTTFSHAYASAASYTARAEILDGNRSLATGSNLVPVTQAFQRNVFLTVSARRSGVDGAGPCWVDGPPLAGQGQVAAVDSVPGVSISLGWFDRGATIDLTQSFRQQASLLYSCNFQVQLRAEPASVRFGTGRCHTGPTSPFPQVIPECSVTIHAGVP